jgi:hypothetical protein
MACLGETAEGSAMRLFSPLYPRAMVWSRPPHAPWHLGLLAYR